MNKKLTPDESLAFIKSRRSVFPKEFELGEVGVHEVKQLLEAARFAPTHKHTEPWRFKVFMSDARLKLAEMQVAATFQSVGINDQTQMKADKMRFNAERSGAVIAIIMKRDPKLSLSLNDELWAVACAVQNIHLHAYSMGLAGFWSTGAAVDLPEIRTMLQLEPDDVHMGWFYLGRFSNQKSLVKERASVDAFASFFHD
jgi:nitroreductase